MALETLKGVSQIDGFDVLEIQNRISPEEYAAALKAGKYVCVNHGVNSIAFTLQKGPVKESGVNGCQVDTLIEAARIILEKLNDRHSCPENNMAIASLNDAIGFLKARKLNREKRGVEGTDQP